jgi:hypothetical protein
MVEATASLHATATMTAEGSVERALNDLRLAVLGILVTIGLTVGFGLQHAWWIRVLAGAGSSFLFARLIAWPRSRHWMMAFMHRVTGG